MDKNIKALLEGTAVKDLVEAEDDTAYMVDPGPYQSLSDDYQGFMTSLRALKPGKNATKRQIAVFNQLKADALKSLKEVDQYLEEMGDMED